MKPTLGFANCWRSLQHNKWHHFEVVPVESACLYKVEDIDVLILNSNPVSFRLCSMMEAGFMVILVC